MPAALNSSKNRRIVNAVPSWRLRSAIVRSIRYFAGHVARAVAGLAKVELLLETRAGRVGASSREGSTRPKALACRRGRNGRLGAYCQAQGRGAALASMIQTICGRADCRRSSPRGGSPPPSWSPCPRPACPRSCRATRSGGSARVRPAHEPPWSIQWQKCVQRDRLEVARDREEVALRRHVGSIPAAQRRVDVVLHPIRSRARGRRGTP